MIWMVSGITFGVSAAILLGIWVLSTGETTQEVVRGRIEHLRAAQNWTGIATDLKLIRDEMFSTIPALHRFLAYAPGASWAQRYISQSGLKTKPAKLLLLSVVIAIFTYLLVGLYVPFYLALPVGILTSLLPLGVVAFTRRKRLNLFEERFPDALDMLSRAVRAGHAFTSALELIGQESPEPVAGEFSITFEEQNYGIPIRDALEHLADRVPLIDVRFLVTALIIQKESGGNLAEVLDQLSRVIRERFRIYRDVKTKTALGRLTAGILIILPFAMLGMMMYVAPDYETVLFHDPIGPILLGFAALLQLIGAILLWRIVTIEV
jgi:tight adherence protein B